MRDFALVLVLCLAPVVWAHAAARLPADRTVLCDSGVLKWKDTGQEVALFGVNYYPPFSENYQDLKLMRLDPEKVIRDDVSHFVRMGIDLVRLHVWDREISDREGNLIDNDHLRLLDYLLDQCKRNGIYAVLTPIAWWQAPGPSDGFSNSYTMPQTTTDPQARLAQQRYLAQFVQHRNRYIGRTYGEEPSIAAFELINEPLYPPNTTDTAVLAYIDALAGAIRDTGCVKPIFYNGWEGHMAAVARSIADGSTFSWYPTGLVSGHALHSNFLPRVQDFPSMRSPALGGKAIGVYEFDAADVGEGYMYPAMARSFRTGGAQFAAQFQYDSLPLARFNAGWQTHYLNLVYTPQKALSFLIASDAFHHLPRLKGYGSYPESSRFGDYRISYEEALSEKVSDKEFLYSNSTTSRPPEPDRLEHIAGYGSSPVVDYKGAGAYFLDRVAPGAWRLEVYPDCVWVRDPFGPTAVGREVARTYWRSRRMRISLPDLGSNFQLISARGGASTTARQGAIDVEPGVFLLRRRDAAVPGGDWAGAPPVMPADQGDLPPAVWYEPPARCVSGRDLPVKLIVAAPGDPKVTLHYRSAAAADWQSADLRQDAPYHYVASIPASAIHPGNVFCRVSVSIPHGTLSFPDGISEEEVSAASTVPAHVLFAAGPQTNVPDLEIGSAPGQTGKAEVAALPGERYAVRMTATGFGPTPSAAGVRLKADPPASPASYDTLVVRARSLRVDTSKVEVGLVQDNGQAFGFEVSLERSWQDVRIPIGSLHPLWQTTAAKPEVGRISEISLAFGAWLYGGFSGRPHGLEVERITLEPPAVSWIIPVLAAQDPIPVLTALTKGIVLTGHEGAVLSIVEGSDGSALRVAVSDFAEPTTAVSFHRDLQDALGPWSGLLSNRRSLHVRARAGEPGTSAVELVLLEDDGAPWGINVPLTDAWTDTKIPWGDLRFFAHWDHPAGRGSPGDRFHPDRLQSINLCFGAWLFPDRVKDRHAVEIEGIWME